MIDVLNAGDVAGAAALSAAFGWPHRVEDWVFFRSLGHGLAWREAGQLGGTALWFPLDDGHAAIGLVQVAPALQGRGIGRRLMQAAMAEAGSRGVLLHATAAGAGLYVALGFAGGGSIAQFQGDCGDVPASHARRATPADHEAIFRLDAEATGFARRGVLAACLAESAVAVSGQGQITGYAMRRRFGRGALIGPVVAADEPTALDLVVSLCEPGFLRLDVPAVPGPLTDGLARLGLRHAGEVQAMTTGEWPASGTVRRFALAAQALG